MVPYGILRAVLGVVVGCLATGLVVTVIAGDQFAGFFLNHTKYLVSITIAIPLPLFFLTMRTAPATIFGFLWCDIVAALATHFMFISPASWVEIRIFNAVFGAVTVLVYRAIAGSVRVVCNDVDTRSISKRSGSRT